MGIQLNRLVKVSVFGAIILVVFFYFHHTINTSLIEYKQQPLFLFNSLFAKNILTIPGGFAKYISLFLTQFFYSNFTGSVIITLITIVSFCNFSNLYKKSALKHSPIIIEYLPVVLVVFLQSKYNIDLQIILTLNFVFLFTTIYFIINKQSLPFRLAYNIIINIGLFFLFGGSALIAYNLLTIANDFLIRRKFAMVLSSIQIITSAVLIYATAIISPHVNIKEAILGILNNYEELSVKVAFIVIVLLSVISLIASPLFKKQNYFATRKAKLQSVFSILTFIIVLSGIYLTSKYSFDKTERTKIYIHQLAHNKQWQQIIDMKNKLPIDDRKIVFEYNRALYHTGQLNSNLFSIPQYYGENGLLLTQYYNSHVLILSSDIFHEMGYIKGSLHWAYEAQTKYEYHPQVIKRIIEDNIILGEYTVAQKFLNILSKSIVHKKWVNEYQSYISNEAAFNKNKELVQLRKNIVKKHFFTNTALPENDLYFIVREHPDNKMAFEYLMALLMLKNDLARITLIVKDLENFDYQKIPQNIEEALTLITTIDKNKNLNLSRLSISERTTELFKSYSKILIKNRGNKSAAQSELASKYGNTFWFYINFISPTTTKREFKEQD